MSTGQGEVKVGETSASRGEELGEWQNSGAHTHLGIPNTRPVEKREQIQEGQPRNRARVHLAHQLTLVDARYVHAGVEHRLARRLLCADFDFVLGDVFLVGETVVRHGFESVRLPSLSPPSTVRVGTRGAHPSQITARWLYTIHGRYVCDHSITPEPGYGG